MTPAAALTNRIREAVSKKGARLFPMTVGVFLTGRIISKLPNGDSIVRGARTVNVGTKGMGDLVGWSPVTITPDMVGKTVAIYSVVEVKAGTDRIRPEQQAFIEAVVKSGGRAGIARSADDAIRICRDFHDNHE